VCIKYLAWVCVVVGLMRGNMAPRAPRPPRGPREHFFCVLKIKIKICVSVLCVYVGTVLEENISEGPDVNIVLP